MFKDIVDENIGLQKTRIEELIKCLEDDDKLKELLFGKKDLEHIEHPGKRRNSCDKNEEAKLPSAIEYEKRIVKCLFYKNRENVSKHCEDCEYKNMHNLEGNYFIYDYEVPSFYKCEKVGAIDLIISDGNIEYATEIKPYKKIKAKDNSETILRMVAEILTYTYGFPKGKYKPAIAFFENTPQEIEWITRDELLNKLIEKANISVFLFKEIEKEKRRFTIEKLK